MEDRGRENTPLPWIKSSRRHGEPKANVVSATRTTSTNTEDLVETVETSRASLYGSIPRGLGPVENTENHKGLGRRGRTRGPLPNKLLSHPSTGRLPTYSNSWVRSLILDPNFEPRRRVTENGTRLINLGQLRVKGTDIFPVYEGHELKSQVLDSGSYLQKGKGSNSQSLVE